MLQDFRSGALKKLYAANTGNSTITAPVAVDKVPSGDGFLSITDGPSGPRRLFFIPFGTAAANKTFSFIVYVYRPTVPHPTDPLLKRLWIPYPIAAFDCTLGAMTGKAGCYVDDTQFFADTVAAATNGIGTTPTDYDIRSPADDSCASVDVSTYGGLTITALFALGTAQATNANALVAML